MDTSFCCFETGLCVQNITNLKYGQLTSMLSHWLHQTALTRTAAAKDRTTATGLGGGERNTVSNEQRPPGTRHTEIIPGVASAWLWSDNVTREDFPEGDHTSHPLGDGQKVMRFQRSRLPSVTQSAPPIVIAHGMPCHGPLFQPWRCGVRFRCGA